MNVDAVPSSIYIIGAQCTGKTTLLKAISGHLRQTQPDLTFAVINELARGVLASTKVNRDDISSGSEKGMQFQKDVLEAQLERELNCQPPVFLISDRSGIDPIAYARKYGSPRWEQEMIKSSSWLRLKERMQHGVVVLCEPVSAWLFDDGVRLMPKDQTEWTELHKIFLELLQESDITFHCLRAATTGTEERVRFILDIWQQGQHALPTEGPPGTR
jgi:predicted ATPase